MFDSLLAKVSALIVSSVAVVAGLFGIASKNDIPAIPRTPAPIVQIVEEPLGATIPVVISLFETSLQSSISSSDSSMTLVSGTDRAGTALSGHMCFTIDEGTSIAEFVCGTASSTSVTSLTRGVSPLTGTSTVTSLKFAHRRGASVKITDYPQLAILSRILNGNETLPSQITFDAAVSSTTMATNLQNVASVAYVNSVAIAGAPNASTAAKGIVEAATTAEVLAGTGTGGTGALLFAPNSLFNQTSSATNLVPVTNTSGKLSQGFFDLTAPWTFTGALTVSATSTTLATTSITSLSTTGTVSFTVPPTTATTTPAGETSLVTKYYVDRFPVPASGVTTRAGNAGAGAQTIAHGLGRVPKYVRITAMKAAINTENAISIGTYNGTTQQAIYLEDDADANTNDVNSTSTMITVIMDDNDASPQYYATISVDATNITLTWAVTGSPSAPNIFILWEAY